MLLAQAQSEGLALLTVDRELAAYGPPCKLVGPFPVLGGTRPHRPHYFRYFSKSKPLSRIQRLTTAHWRSSSRATSATLPWWRSSSASISALAGRARGERRRATCLLSSTFTRSRTARGRSSRRIAGCPWL